MPPPTMVLKSETVACVSVMAPPPRCFRVFGALSLLFGGVMASLHSAAVKSSSFSIFVWCRLQKVGAALQR